MPRLKFSNVPTAGGGVISGDISTGSGSPFGEGGRYEAQVKSIKKTIANAPKGTYDPKYWDDFLQLNPEENPELFLPKIIETPTGMERVSGVPTFVGVDDPSVIAELNTIPAVRTARTELYLQTQAGCVKRGRCSQDQKNVMAKEKKEYETTIALHVNNILKKKNAPLIEAVEKQKKQAEINAAVKLALEKKVRETSTPPPSPPPALPPPATMSTEPNNFGLSLLPIIIATVLLSGILLFLRRRA
jgi:hypothetical protein